ncbi:hypothetical protein CEXT_803821 [Caerostris extrusa]|uniref:Uncharacterized protein n=1 Tax=Caerostris extrusa TaxID=172846 RepID=A0AAV4Y2M7_CAEEX|nr:hypothetical protein CEXT_803821 [Caerostris extrusa]
MLGEEPPLSHSFASSATSKEEAASGEALISTSEGIRFASSIMMLNLVNLCKKSPVEVFDQPFLLPGRTKRFHPSTNSRKFQHCNVVL